MNIFNQEMILSLQNPGMNIVVWVWYISYRFMSLNTWCPANGISLEACGHIGGITLMKNMDHWRFQGKAWHFFNSFYFLLFTLCFQICDSMWPANILFCFYPLSHLTLQTTSFYKTTSLAGHRRGDACWAVVLCLSLPPQHCDVEHMPRGWHFPGLGIELRYSCLHSKRYWLSHLCSSIRI